MTNEIQDLLIPLAKGMDLTAEQAERAFQIIMNGGATPAQMGAFLMGLRAKGETVTEIVAGATIMRAKAPRVHVPEGAIDTCGTGGDARGTLNISTAVAILVAACGVPVAKHGNRSVTSASGSADVLKALGVNIEAGRTTMERALAACGVGFFYAPHYHVAARHIAPVRTELGLRTIFNILGPLCNPAQPAYQLVGVYSSDLLHPMAQALHELGVKKAWVVIGEDGVDEISITGPTKVVILDNGTIQEQMIDPADAGLPHAALTAIAGSDVEYNARAIAALYAGEHGAYRDVVLLNSAACLIITGKTATLTEGVAMAAQALDSGKAREVLATLCLISRETPHV